MAIHSPNTTLSTNDARILNALFDPETLPSSVAASKSASMIDASLPPHPNIPSSQLSILETQQNDIVREISSSSSPSRIEDAIRQEDAIIEKHPNYPSPHLNRAMLRRLHLESALPKNQTLFSAPEEQISALFTDLSRAIHISLPSASPSSPVSPYQARILRTAYAHRAYLYLKAAETGVQLIGKGNSELEELASSDFAAAARYGDEVAREMSVRTNPYAKMCGAIVRNALKEERGDYGG
ncbi:hypothetical protein BU26DRAFT_523545 [Trematosphaeria pertusa]|uniref:Uncharacterized protein n=1 Tax=Trematosphaeria pertusa TaxID=390896 RepID=A0A6A6I0U2_9PLEO|nr:uncharacterized protein BU26DRAFT_523545 [Trematosphaeria pertusa]KAF2243190.1 hypothetical protein BU26DRAFT_523545 [Trematosphaeria pertusa]